MAPGHFLHPHIDNSHDMERQRYRILNLLYEMSPLQKTVSIILLALVDGRPRVLNLKQMLEEFIRHRATVIPELSRTTVFDGDAAPTRSARPNLRSTLVPRKQS